MAGFKPKADFVPARVDFIFPGFNYFQVKRKGWGWSEVGAETDEALGLLRAKD